MKYKILSIDAWAGSCGECEACASKKDLPGSLPGCWEWNAWYNAGETETLPETTEQFLRILNENGYGCLKSDCWEIEDDGYNIVLIGKDNRKPYFAIEFGQYN